MTFETFAPLNELPGIHHAFSLRTTADTKADDYPARFVRSLGYTTFADAEQPHGNRVATIRSGSGLLAATGVDALITNRPGLPLVIRCADCAAIYLVATGTPAIGLIHSGKKGTLANIAGATVAAMTREYRTPPGTLRAFIGPSIGPCHYDMDIWTPIENQLRAAGVTDIHNPRTCTACHLDRYYSYRAEKGQTGRMFALLALR